MAQHAHTVEDKLARRDAILAAASRLFNANHGSLPSVADISVAAGLAKGTVYLYFRTKEEIFIALLSDGLDKLATVLEDCLRDLKSAPHNKVKPFLRTYVQYLGDNPDLLRLDAISHGVLEKNLERDKLIEFKQGLVKRLGLTGEVVEKAFELDTGRGVTVLMRTWAMTRGLWQNYPAERTDCELLGIASQLHATFDVELFEALEEYLHGAI